MKVLLVTPLHGSAERGYSIERYAYEVDRGLTRRGVAVTAISSSSRLDKVEETRAGRAIGIAYEGLRVIRSLREAALIHYTDPVIGMTAFTVRHRPVVTTVHEVPDPVSHETMLSPGIKILRLACRISDSIIVDSSITREDLVKMGVSADKIGTVNLGVSQSFKPIQRTQRRGFKTVGYVGAFSPRKNVGLLLDAFALLRREHPGLDVHLELWGRTGRYKEEIESKIRSLGVDGVLLRGFAEEGSLPEIYNSFDVFVFPSMKEGFGLPILEAKRCGVPTVLFGKGRIPREVAAGSATGSDESEMAAEIFRLLSDSDYAAKVVREGLKASADMTWEKTTEGVLKVYNSLGFDQRN